MLIGTIIFGQNHPKRLNRDSCRLKPKPVMLNLPFFWVKPPIFSGLGLVLHFLPWPPMSVWRWRHGTASVAGEELQHLHDGPSVDHWVRAEVAQPILGNFWSKEKVWKIYGFSEWRKMCTDWFYESNCDLELAFGSLPKLTKIRGSNWAFGSYKCDYVHMESYDIMCMYIYMCMYTLYVIYVVLLHATVIWMSYIKCVY